MVKARRMKKRCKARPTYLAWWGWFLNRKCRRLETMATVLPTHPYDFPDGMEFFERATRIELAFSAWEADVLPLNYARGGQPHYRLRSM